MQELGSGGKYQSRTREGGLVGSYRMAQSGLARVPQAFSPFKPGGPSHRCSDGSRTAENCLHPLPTPSWFFIHTSLLLGLIPQMVPFTPSLPPPLRPADLPVAPIPCWGSLGSGFPTALQNLTNSVSLSSLPTPTSSCSFTGSHALEVECRGSPYRQHLLCITVPRKGL